MEPGSIAVMVQGCTAFRTQRSKFSSAKFSLMHQCKHTHQCKHISANLVKSGSLYEATQNNADIPIPFFHGFIAVILVGFFSFTSQMEAK